MGRSRLNHPESLLMQRTLEKLRECEIDRLTIYRATAIPPQWLYAFLTGKIPDPSVNRVTVLYFYLGGAWKDLVE